MAAQPILCHDPELTIGAKGEIGRAKNPNLTSGSPLDPEFLVFLSHAELLYDVTRVSGSTSGTSSVLDNF